MNNQEKLKRVNWNLLSLVCKKCGHRNFDVQSWWDKTNTNCPNCGDNYD